MKNGAFMKIILVVLMLAMGVGMYACINGGCDSCSCGSSSYSGGGSTSKCTICRKPATHVFQGSGYCDQHYQDAVNWAIDQPKN